MLTRWLLQPLTRGASRWTATCHQCFRGIASVPTALCVVHPGWTSNYQRQEASRLAFTYSGASGDRRSQQQPCPGQPNTEVVLGPKQGSHRGHPASYLGKGALEQLQQQCQQLGDCTYDDCIMCLLNTTHLWRQGVCQCLADRRAASKPATQSRATGDGSCGADHRHLCATGHDQGSKAASGARAHPAPVVHAGSRFAGNGARGVW